MSAHKSIIPFEPAKVRPRHDGWTAEKQMRFIEALAETACVDEACRRVGMSDSSAYALRHRPCGAAFRHAWDAALDCAMHRVEQAAISRSIDGTPRPVFYKGEQIGEWRHFDERLTTFLLRSRRSARYGKWTEQLPPPNPEQHEDDGIMLDGGLTAIEQRAPVEHGNPLNWEDEDEAGEEE